MPPGSTQVLLLLSAGASLYLGLFHFGARRQHPAHTLLSLWAFASTGFVVARFVQLEASGPELAIAAARISTGLAGMMLSKKDSVRHKAQMITVIGANSRRPRKK